MWFDDDICFCGNKEKCPKKENCRRARNVAGFHTYSLFYKENEECEYYLPKDKDYDK